MSEKGSLGFIATYPDLKDGKRVEFSGYCRGCFNLDTNKCSPYTMLQGNWFCRDCFPKMVNLLEADRTLKELAEEDETKNPDGAGPRMDAIVDLTSCIINTGNIHPNFVNGYDPVNPPTLSGGAGARTPTPTQFVGTKNELREFLGFDKTSEKWGDDNITVENHLSWLDERVGACTPAATQTQVGLRKLLAVLRDGEIVDKEPEKDYTKPSGGNPFEKDWQK